MDKRQYKTVEPCLVDMAPHQDQDLLPARLPQAGAQIRLSDHSGHAAFDEAFQKLTGNSPFPWQRRLYLCFMSGDIPTTCCLPTGLGKTSILVVWYIAYLHGGPVPRRLVYVMNRRTVVDQTTTEMQRMLRNAQETGLDDSLAISVLRGQMADNREWSKDPSRPAIICGTIDMVGSRLGFCGYGSSYKLKPFHAGLLGQDSLHIHDEAHLEPAAQIFFEEVVKEQAKVSGALNMRLMAVTATPRTQGSDTEVFTLDNDDYNHPVVHQRINAPKRLYISVEDDLRKAIIKKALEFKNSGKRILVFCESVEDVVTTVEALTKVAPGRVQNLTGTMRNYERNALVETDPVFKRFLSSTDDDADSKTMYLVCTSAGEVGVDLSAHHMVCDLSTWEAMAQRFGRVNRRGLFPDSEIHVYADRKTVEPAKAEAKVKGKKKADAKPKPKEDRDARKAATLALLRTLDGDASPKRLAEVPTSEQVKGFSAPPEIRNFQRMLLDQWSRTTNRSYDAARYPIAPYLHGEDRGSEPSVKIVWREEVDLVQGPEMLKAYRPDVLLEKFTIKPFEFLTEPVRRVAEVFSKVLKRPDTKDLPIWVQDPYGKITVTSLGKITSYLKDDSYRYRDHTLLLSAKRSSPVGGLLKEEGFMSPHGGQQHATADIADKWCGQDGQTLRARVMGTKGPKGMRKVVTIFLPSNQDDDDTDEDIPDVWSWFESTKGDGDFSRDAPQAVALDVHLRDVEREAQSIVDNLPNLSPELKTAVVYAARCHDLGKDREVFQRMLSNEEFPAILLAKSKTRRSTFRSTFRHELGSALDVAERVDMPSGVDRDLVLHLIAAHHGRARPGFPIQEQGDPNNPQIDDAELAAEGARRFWLLQRRYGHYVLAYLESLVKAADYAASSAPSETIDTDAQ